MLQYSASSLAQDLKETGVTMYFAANVSPKAILFDL